MKNLKYSVLFAALAAFAAPISAQTFVGHTVNQAPLLVADAGAAISFCAGDSIHLGGAPSAIGGTAPFLYNWQPPTDLNSATVANPIATPAGSATYTLTLIDGQNCSSTSTVSATLTTASVSFSSSANLLSVTFSDLSSNAANWAWEFGDGATSPVQNPTHTYNSAGTYQVCLTINVNGTCEMQFCDSITIVSVGLVDAISDSKVLVYPNPTPGNEIMFEVQGAAMEGMIQIELFDLQGKLVQSYEGAANQNLHRLNRKNLAAGAYQYRVRTADSILGAGKVVFQ